ncbi:MAG: hypothetical protein ACRDLB_13630 [Actinomycetota bacterium]
MATLAYLLLPLSGIAAYLGGGTARIRFHGLQAIVFGTVWPLALYGGSAISTAITKVVFVAGAVLWVVFLAGTVVGRDPRIPVLGPMLERAARDALSGSRTTR